MSQSQATLHRSCPTCEASCGLTIEVDRERNEVLSIHGDQEDHRSRGYVCAKSQAFHHVHRDPERLRHPVRRNGKQWEEISWEEAFKWAGERLGTLRSEHGKDNIALYVGNPTGHEVGVQMYMQLFIGMLDTERFFSAGSLDQQPKNLSAVICYGDPWLIPVPDLDHSDLFVCMGANPVVSQGSLMSAPDFERRREDLRERGGRMVVIDPRRSETAQIADQHLFIRPGTDAFFLFSFIHVLYEEGLATTGRLGEFTDGIEEVRAAAERFSPEDTEPLTGIPATTTRALVRDFCAAERPVLYGRIGLCTQRFGTLASWLVDVVNLLSGRLDERGGLMFARPATGNFEPWMPTMDFPQGRFKSRVRGVPECYGQLPASLMAEELAAPDDDRVRGLITLAGNPVLSSPDGPALREALKQLDFMVSVDIYINETTSMADLILPPRPQLECSNYDFLFQGTSVRNFARYTPQVLTQEAGTMPQWEIILNLLGAMHGMTLEQLDDLVVDGLIDLGISANPRLKGMDKDTVREKIGDERGWERLVDFMVRGGPYGDAFDDDAQGLSLAKLKEHPHGLDLGPLQPCLPELLRTDDKRIHLMHPLLRSEIERLSAELESGSAARTGAGDMLLIGRRHIRDMNSWLHNLHNYTRGRDRCTLRVHPDDASRLGLTDGGAARLSAANGNQVTAPVEISDELMPGVVSLPHGFGHVYSDTGQSNALDSAGVSCNFVIDPTELDIPSSTSVLNGARINIAAA